MTSDREHLQWIYQRMVVVHGENPQYDYMIRLQEIIDAQVTHEEIDIMMQDIDRSIQDFEDEKRGK